MHAARAEGNTFAIDAAEIRGVVVAKCDGVIAGECVGVGAACIFQDFRRIAAAWRRDVFQCENESGPEPGGGAGISVC